MSQKHSSKQVGNSQQPELYRKQSWAPLATWVWSTVTSWWYLDLSWIMILVWAQSLVAVTHQLFRKFRWVVWAPCSPVYWLLILLLRRRLLWLRLSFSHAQIYWNVLIYTGDQSYYNNLGGSNVRKEKKYGYIICIICIYICIKFIWYIYINIYIYVIKGWSFIKGSQPRLYFSEYCHNFALLTCHYIYL